MILMVMGICDIQQGEPMFIEKAEDRVRRSAVDGHGAVRPVNEITEVVGAVAKLLYLQHETSNKE